MTWETRAACHPLNRSHWPVDAATVFFGAERHTWWPVCSGCATRAECLVQGVLGESDGTWGGEEFATVLLVRSLIAAGLTTVPEVLTQRGLSLQPWVVQQLAWRALGLVVDPDTLVPTGEAGPPPPPPDGG